MNLMQSWYYQNSNNGKHFIVDYNIFEQIQEFEYRKVDDHIMH